MSSFAHFQQKSALGKGDAASSSTAGSAPAHGETDLDHLDFDERERAGRGGDDAEPQEKAHVDKELGDSNLGRRMLMKMGWKAGKGLGKDAKGRVEPVRAIRSEDMLGTTYQVDSLGLGKRKMDDEQAESATQQRRRLESEIEETPEIRRKREEKDKKETMIRQEVQDMVKVFYCDICHKQYKKVSEYEEHLSSYDHHHRKRLREFRESERGPKEVAEARKAKEKDREMQRMMRMAAAAKKEPSQSKKEPSQANPAETAPSAPKAAAAPSSANAAAQPKVQFSLSARPKVSFGIGLSGLAGAKRNTAPSRSDSGAVPDAAAHRDGAESGVGAPGARADGDGARSREDIQAERRRRAQMLLSQRGQ